MTLLAAYDRARAALAQATRVDEVLAVRDEMEHVRLYGRQIKDRTLIADATDLQTQAERRLGELLLEAERLGWIGRGRPKKATVDTPVDSQKFTLEEAGIDRTTAARSQKLAAIPQEQFDLGREQVRAKIMSGASTLINGARAIMSSRVEADDSLDYFPTPPWATRALIEYVFYHLGVDLAGASAVEPACGEGHIAEVLTEFFAQVIAADVHDYGYGLVQDFLADEVMEASRDVGFDWYITNPPFLDKAEAFVLRAIELARKGVAMFVRLQWLETEGRYENIFRDNPPTLIAFFVERVNLCAGCWDPKGGTATAYIWLVWVKGMKPQAPFWIPPGCRTECARTDDVERFTKHPVQKRAA